jgi:hypothetical protein
LIASKNLLSLLAPCSLRLIPIAYLGDEQLDGLDVLLGGRDAHGDQRLQDLSDGENED